MSNYHKITQHPETGEMVTAEWLDDHFGRHRYGVRFPDGKIFRADQIEAIEVNGVGAESSVTKTRVYHWDGSHDSHRKST